MAKNNKMAGVHGISMDQPESMMHLEGAHAKSMAKLPMGKKGKVIVHGTKTKHYVNSDGSHSITMRLHNVSPFNDDSAVSGPHGKGSDNDQSSSPAI